MNYQKYYMSGSDIRDSDIVRQKTGNVACELLDVMRILQNMQTFPEDKNYLQQSLTYVFGIERLMLRVREEIERKLKTEN